MGLLTKYRIADVGRVVTGKTPPTEDEDNFGADYPFLTPTDMQGTKWSRRTERGISLIGASKLRGQIPPRSVAVSCIGWQMGKAILTDRPTYTNQQINTIIPNKLADPEYLYYYFATRRDELLSIGSAGGVRTPIVSKSSFEAIEIYLPSLVVQRRIASILCAYDDLIENNTRRIAILEEITRRIYEEWFVRFRFPGHENVRMVESELGLVPEGWKILPASVAVHVNPATKVPKEGLKHFVAMNCLSDGSMLINGWAMRLGNSGSKFSNGDTLFARITPCLQNGKTGFVQFLPDANTTAFGSTEFIVLRSKTLTPEFVYLLARSESFRENAIKSMSGASGRQRVREACFDTFLLPQPDSRTLSRFTELARPMFRLVHTLEKKSANLRTTRDLLLPRLISGELDVSSLPKLEAAVA